MSAPHDSMIEGELAEIALGADLSKLERGLYADRKEMTELVEEALASVALLHRFGFSRGPAALAEIEAALHTLSPLRKSAR